METHRVEALDVTPLSLSVVLLVSFVVEDALSDILFSKYPFHEFGDCRVGFPFE